MIRWLLGHPGPAGPGRRNLILVDFLGQAEHVEADEVSGEPPLVRSNQLEPLLVVQAPGEQRTPNSFNS